MPRSPGRRASRARSRHETPAAAGEEAVRSRSHMQEARTGNGSGILFSVSDQSPRNNACLNSIRVKPCQAPPNPSSTTPAIPSVPCCSARWPNTSRPGGASSVGQFDGPGDHYTPPAYVEKAFRKYLECGIFAHGFARARCDDCGHDFLVAFSCNGRGVCPRATHTAWPRPQRT